MDGCHTSRASRHGRQKAKTAAHGAPQAQKRNHGPQRITDMPAGRPSAYKAEYAEQVKKLAQLGATDQEVADFFEVDVRTIYRWKHDYDEFCQSLKVGKDIADDRVERSLYQKAIGYEQDEVKIFMPSQALEPVYAPYRAKIAPDTTAAIFWLKNRRSGAWHDKREVEHSGGMEVTTKDQRDAAIAAALRANSDE